MGFYFTLIKKRFISNYFPGLWFTRRLLALGTAGGEIDIEMTEGTLDNAIYIFDLQRFLNFTFPQVRPVETQLLVCTKHSSTMQRTSALPNAK